MGICDYRMGGRTVRALEAWKRAVNMKLMQKRASPALLLALDQLAAHHRSEGKPEDWKKTVNQLSEFFPENPITIRELRLFARQCLIKGDYIQASAIYERFEKQLSEEDRQNMNLAHAMAESGAAGSALVKSANARLERNEPELAARLYGEALKMNLRDDETYEAMTKLGWCLYLRDDFKRAEKAWKEVITSAPKGNEWRGKSRWHMVVLLTGPYGKSREAIALCEEQVKEFDGGFLGQQAAFARAWLLKTEGKWKEAKQGFENLLESYPLTASCPALYRHIEECEQGLSALR